MAALLIFPDTASHAVRSGLLLCGATVIPALFPFLVLSRLLIGVLPKTPTAWMEKLMNRFFGVSGSCFPALIISFLGSYPVGVSAVVSLYENGAITKQDAQRALRFCNNSGPGFFIGIVGGVIFRDITAGILLYLCHVLSAILCGLFYAEPKAPILLRKPTAAPKPFSELLLSSITDTCTVLLQLCGMIVSFSLLSTYLTFTKLSVLSAPIQSILLGSLEITTGILHLSADAASFAAAGFIMSWGGLCVHMQAKTLWSRAGLRPNGYYSAKLLQGLLSALFACTLLMPSPMTVSVSVCFAGICIFFPHFRKKHSGNLRHSVV